MNLAKFISLIQNESLYFTRSDKFEDPFEGSSTIATNQLLENSVQDLPAEAQKNFVDMLRKSSTVKENFKRFVAINCWHMNENESVAMWGLYLQEREGIAIQTTYANLKQSIVDQTPVKIGIVTYIDYINDIIDPGNLFYPYVHKRLGFKHENEIRAVVSKFPRVDEPSNFSGPGLEEGVLIKVDLKALIETIYISPNAQSWFSKLVSRMISNYGFDFNIIQSALDERPVY